MIDKHSQSKHWGQKNY